MTTFGLYANNDPARPDFDIRQAGTGDGLTIEAVIEVVGMMGDDPVPAGDYLLRIGDSKVILPVSVGDDSRVSSRGTRRTLPG